MVVRTPNSFDRFFANLFHNPMTQSVDWKKRRAQQWWVKTAISSDLTRGKLYFLGQQCSRASAGLGLSSSHRFSFPPWDTSITPCPRNPAKMLLKDILLPLKLCFYRIFLSHQLKGLVFSNLNNNDHLKIAPGIGYMKFISSIMVGPPKKKKQTKTEW